MKSFKLLIIKYLRIIVTDFLVQLRFLWIYGSLRFFTEGFRKSIEIEIGIPTMRLNINHNRAYFFCNLAGIQILNCHKFKICIPAKLLLKSTKKMFKFYKILKVKEL